MIFEGDRPIYLDYNATTPIDSHVLEIMLPYLQEHFGNPSSNHVYGVQARQSVEEARRQVAEMLGCQEEEVIFTSGGTEANNLAIKGAAFAMRERGNHIITSAVEHPAVLEVCAWLKKQDYRVTVIDVDRNGQVNAEEVEWALTPQTTLISIMHANNEVGTIQPIREIAEIAHRHNIVIHTDAAQSVGKIDVNVQHLDVDLLSIAGHKIYAPKGVGALYVRAGTPLEKVTHGASHEFNLRPGTENVAGIVGLGEACHQVRENLNIYQTHMRAMRDRLEKCLLVKFPWARINGFGAERLPNTSSVGFPHMAANTILAACTEVAASTGAACHAADVQISHVLKAMGVPQEYARGTIRFSVGRKTTMAEIEQTTDAMIRAIQRLRVD